MSELKLSHDKTLWDIGAGSGSIGISAALIFHTASCLFEKNEVRLNHIKQNIMNLHAVAITVYEGNIMETMKLCPSTPDRIFIGGGGKEVGYVIAELYHLLKEEGFILAAYASLTNLQVAMETCRKAFIPFTVRSIMINEYEMGELYISGEERMLFLLKTGEKRKPH